MLLRIEHHVLLLFATIILLAVVDCQIIFSSVGSCIESGCPSCCYGIKNDCYCDKACLSFQDCCTDVYQLDICEDISGLECETGSVRLVSGAYVNEGLVEICIFGSWRPVCDYPFNNNEATVICKSLGYPNVQEIAKGEGNSNSNTHYGAMCTGYETKLTECLIDINFCQSNITQQPFIKCKQTEEIQQMDYIDMACTMDCNPLSDDIQQYDDPCCDLANTGKFIKVIESKVSRKYIACPKAPSDWCSL